MTFVRIQNGSLHPLMKISNKQVKKHFLSPFPKIGSLEDRTLLQGAQAKPQGEDLHWNQRKRATNQDLDSPHRSSALQVDASPLQGWGAAVFSTTDFT